MLAESVNDLFEGKYDKRADTIIQNMLKQDKVDPETDLDDLHKKVVQSLKKKDGKYEDFDEMLGAKAMNKVVDFIDTAKNRSGYLSDIVKEALINDYYNGDSFEFEADTKAEKKVEAIVKGVAKDLVKSIANHMKTVK